MGTFASRSCCAASDPRPGPLRAWLALIALHLAVSPQIPKHVPIELIRSLRTGVRGHILVDL